MTSAELADYEWLTGDEARRCLTQLADDRRTVDRLAKTLRRDLSAVQTHLVIEQIDLRRRARVKFSRADEMFFTRQGLEQATDERLAQYKSSRISAAACVADLCCGIGGDALSLAKRRSVVAIDRDPIVAHLLRANARVCGANQLQALVDDVQHVELPDPWSLAVDRAWHIDPDRRASGQRTTSLAGCEPGLDTIARWEQVCVDGAVKLAPATEVPDAWRLTCEREWIETRGECRQQVLWFGRTARFAGRCTATIISGDGSIETLVEDPACETIGAERPQRYVAEPRASVFAASLVETLAERFQARRLGPPGGYLTCDQVVANAAWRQFEVLEFLPLDRRRLREVLRQRGWGKVVWKCRNADVEVPLLEAGIRPLAGTQTGVVLVTRFAQQVWAILAQPLNDAMNP